jgi:hypothetical protein
MLMGRMRRVMKVRSSVGPIRGTRQRMRAKERSRGPHSSKPQMASGSTRQGSQRAANEIVIDDDFTDVLLNQLINCMRSDQTCAANHHQAFATNIQERSP